MELSELSVNLHLTRCGHFIPLTTTAFYFSVRETVEKSEVLSYNFAGSNVSGMLNDALLSFLQVLEESHVSVFYNSANVDVAVTH